MRTEGTQNHLSNKSPAYTILVTRLMNCRGLKVEIHHKKRGGDDTVRIINNLRTV
jgi:hypothetical protein